MGRMYTVQISNLTTTTAIGLLELTGITNGIVVLHSAFVGSSTEEGDAQAETQRVQIVRHNASAAGGTAITVFRPHLANEASFTGAAEKSNTYAATNAVILTETFNIQAGWYYTPTPEERIVIPPNSVSVTYPRLAIDLPDAPAGSDSTSYSVRATFEVIG